MKLPKQKYAVAAREAKPRIENPLTEAQKAKKITDDAKRLRQIQRAADRNSESLRVMAEIRSVVGLKG